MERWLNNVAHLEYQADLLLVDNSPGLEYVETVKGYCAKYGVTNYKIKHLEIAQGEQTGKTIDEQIHERLALSREIIRHELLASDYEAYFYWENDILIPYDGLGKLVDLMQAGDFLVVDHNSWINNIPNQVSFDYGIVLFSRACLEKYSFIPPFGASPEVPDNWYEAEKWFRQRLFKEGCCYTEVQGIIEPVYHLAKTTMDSR